MFLAASPLADAPYAAAIHAVELATSQRCCFCAGPSRRQRPGPPASSSSRTRSCRSPTPWRARGRSTPAAACTTSPSRCAGRRRCSTPTSPARSRAHAHTRRRASCCSGCTACPATSTPSSAASAAGPPQSGRPRRGCPHPTRSEKEPAMAPTIHLARARELDDDEAAIFACAVVEREPDADVPDGRTRLLTAPPGTRRDPCGARRAAAREPLSHGRRARRGASGCRGDRRDAAPRSSRRQGRHTRASGGFPSRRSERATCRRRRRAHRADAHPAPIYCYMD